MYTIVGIGELLWDRLLAGDQLGGAPANFAYHTSLLGNDARIFSRVGRDTPGEQATRRLRALGLTTDFIQQDETHATGTVVVQVDASGQPDFVINEDVAWDYLEFTPQWQTMAAAADAVCFGTLAQRSPASRLTIRRFLEATRTEALRIYDVNLRQSFYTREIIADSLHIASIAKINHSELAQLAAIFQLAGSSQTEIARRLLDEFSLELVCVTRGERGSVLVSRTEAVEHAGFSVEVVDAVGAGDAFTAALAHHYLNRAPLAVISEAANRMGATVASHTGATPVIERDILLRVVKGN
ncbi:MAG: carbohydrate kinase family protein [Blastocatellia bacterium]